MNQEKQLTEIPIWHMELLRERIEAYSRNPDQALDFDKAMDEIESELG